MTKHSTSSSFNSQDFLEEWLEHPAIEWISANRKTLLWGLFSLFAALILAYRVLAWQNTRSEEDYFRANFLFQEIQNPSYNNDKRAPLQELAAIMQRRPELQAKYDGALAQMMIIENSPTQAIEFAKPTFKRVRPDRLNAFENYAETSLLISQGLYDQAMERSTELQNKLTENDFPLLKVYNTLRLAALAQQLDQPAKELAAWNTLLQDTHYDPDATVPLAQLYKAGETSLGKYIEARKNDLTP